MTTQTAIATVIERLYRSATGRPPYARRLLTGAVADVGASAGRANSGERNGRTAHAPFAQPVRPFIRLVKLLVYRPYQTYLVAWTASKTLRTYHTRVTRRSCGAAVRAVKRQPWVKQAGRFMLISVQLSTDTPVNLDAAPIRPIVEAEYPTETAKPKTAKTATKTKRSGCAGRKSKATK